MLREEVNNWKTTKGTRPCNLTSQIYEQFDELFYSNIDEIFCGRFGTVKEW